MGCFIKTVWILMNYNVMLICTINNNYFYWCYCFYKHCVAIIKKGGSLCEVNNNSMNKLTTSPVAQYCMQIKDEASTLVKVVGQQKNTTKFDASVTEMNSTDQLSTLIVDKNGISLSQRRTRQCSINRSWHAYMRYACMNAIYSKRACYI